jgi:glycosyltransferase involved in cell wall biosynthesis
MKILSVASTYPYPGHPFAGIFSQRCIAALRDLSERVEVLAPRPYVPRLLSLVPRWKAYATIKKYEIRDGVCIHRPATPVLPRIGSAFWVDQAPYLVCGRLAKKLHHRSQFDAIVSFDLVEAGGVAWRVAKNLGIPASGWAFGNDMRFPRSSSLAQVVTRALQRLDIVFYQSYELLEKAAYLLGISPSQLPAGRHIVLPHGIPEPPSLSPETRDRIRKELGIDRQQLLIINTSRICRAKGLFHLMDAMSDACVRDSRLVCALVGSQPAFDDTGIIQERLEQSPALKGRLRIIPGCNPNKVWEYLSAADIFAFTSLQEGMPNSLLEAMAMGVPAVAFGIPPVMEIEAGSGTLITVPPFDPALFADAIVSLAASSHERAQIGARGKNLILDRFLVRKNIAVALDRLAEIKAARAQTR